MTYWFVLYTLPRNEKKLATWLSTHGYEVYCPLAQTMRQWSDRKKKVEVPLFPSYVFIHIEEAQRYEVLEAPGARNYVFWLGKPAIVRDSEIEAIKKICAEGEDVKVSTLEIKQGDQIEILYGPFKGLMGTVDKVNKSNVTLHLQQLNCQIQFKYTKRFLKVSEGG